MSENIDTETRAKGSDSAPRLVGRLAEALEDLLPPHSGLCVAHDGKDFVFQNGHAVVTRKSCRCGSYRKYRDLLAEVRPGSPRAFPYDSSNKGDHWQA